jgi:hypothetical protein
MKFQTLLLTLLLLTSAICIAQTSSEISSFTDFLHEQKQSAKEYILDLFKTHDIVVVCERDHREITQYDLFLDIISDKRFVNTVGNVFTEIGISNLNPTLNIFLHTKNIPKDDEYRQILNFQRNLSSEALWEKYNYTYFLGGVYKINSQLSKEKAIWLYPYDVPFNWQTADSSNYKRSIMSIVKNRDSIIASQIIEQLAKISKEPARHKKALVIMNYRHAFNMNFSFPDGGVASNVTAFLFKHYGSSVANVLLNQLKPTSAGKQLLVQDGKWDAAFANVGNKTLGFNLSGTPFGKDSFDLWPIGKPAFTYQDIFTGFAFYQPIENQTLVTGIPGFLDSAYFDEFFRRFKLSAALQNFPKQEIENLEKNPQDLEKEINGKREYQYQDIDSLKLERAKWYNDCHRRQQ